MFVSKLGLVRNRLVRVGCRYKKSACFKSGKVPFKSILNGTFNKSIVTDPISSCDRWPGLTFGGGLGAPPGGVPLAAAPEQQVHQGLGALQRAALLLRALALLLLLVLLLVDLCRTGTDGDRVAPRHTTTETNRWASRLD